jgi:trehalose 6-phosphate phosphatase
MNDRSLPLLGHEPDIRTIARTPHLLVACDYDGTLAPIVDDPSAAPPLPEAIAALRSLASLHNTSVAVISGRALRDLALMSRLPSEVHLVGSHGSEMDADFAFAIPDERRQVLAEIARRLGEIAAATPGAFIEHKPTSVALHVRLAARDLAADAVVDAAKIAEELPDVTLRHGKEVIELAVLRTHKGDAIDRLRHTVGATAVLFVGDDVTDEDAFASLGGPDIGVKVGAGATCATYRIADPQAAVRLLAELGELRHQWLFGASVTPIEKHSVLSDHRTVALVTDTGNITWLCHPRLDSAAVFGDLLGGPSAGGFLVRPASESDVLTQRYLPGSMILETRWPEITVLDYLDVSDGRATAPPGRTDLLRVVSGTGAVDVRFAPRPDFGRSGTQLRVDGCIVEVIGTSTPMVLVAPGVSWTIEHDGLHETAHGRMHLDGAACVLELRLGTRDHDPDPRGEIARRRATDDHWRHWESKLVVPDVAPELVRRSALMIKSLVYGPSGALAAAATTSLPEELGGVRNWDYRYCWIRDAALATASLARLGSLGEGLAYLDWLVELIEHDNRPDQLHPVYALDGGALAPEAVIAELSGYAGSRPVRVGNLADHQVQLDVFGPVAVLVDELDRRGARLTDRHLRLLEQLAEAVLRRWHEPDHGIWEERIAAQQHVHSKVMCWLTLDRAVEVYTRRNIAGRGALSAVRDHIRDEVLERGWNPTIGSFTATYDGTSLDAAALCVGLSGMLPGTDERFASTVHAVETSLRKGPVVWRYLHDDGLPGREGGFLLCALWLAEAYLLCGRDVDAIDLFEQVCDLAGPTGSMSEQFDPRRGVALGNVPQTYSHHGVIDVAVRLAARRHPEAADLRAHRWPRRPSDLVNRLPRRRHR